MFHHLLLPLDGSHLAEAGLTPARSLARQLGARITLLHVLEQNPPEKVHGDRHLQTIPEAEAYLNHQADLLRHDGFLVDVHAHAVAEGDVALSIIQHAHEYGADLVVLCTHGSGGPKGFEAGSIAQRVIGAEDIPVLIIHPDAAPPAFLCRRLVVPLDGTPCHESSVPVAAELARATGSSVELITVVPRRSHLAGAGGVLGRMLPSAMSALLDEQERELARRLEELAGQMKAAGIAASSRVDRGDPIPCLLRELQRSDADLVVLATHTRHGWAAFWSGSVAPRLIAQWRRPVLLVRAMPEA